MSRALVLTRERSLAALVERATDGSLVVEVHSGIRKAHDRLAWGDTRLLVVDDYVLAEHERGWFLDRARRIAPDAFIVYVASRHSPDVERKARARGVAYYTSRPLDEERFELLLLSWKKPECSHARDVAPTSAALGNR
jgi:hypothetical protein